MGDPHHNLKVSTIFALTCIVLFLLPVNVFAQTGIAKPLTPEFSAEYVAGSYYVPPTYGLDPFTGENVTIQQGYQVDNDSIVFKIKNQPFKSIEYSYANTSLYYNFRFKPHYLPDWTYYPFSESGLSGRYFAGYTQVVEFPVFEASNDEFTEVAIKIGRVFFNGIPEGGLVDVEVQAQKGYIQSMADGFYRFKGESSDWGAIQTVTISATKSTSSLSITPTITDIPTINQNGIEIYSNSTISFFSVNNTALEVNFVVGGPSNTAGYVKILVAKSFVSNGDFKVNLDGKEISYDLEDNEDSWAMTFTYNHSEHQVTIRATSNSSVFSELPEWVWTATIVAVVGGLAVSGGIVFWLMKKKT